MALLAGVGDPVFWFTVRPIWSTRRIYCRWWFGTWPYSSFVLMERHPPSLPVVHPGVIKAGASISSDLSGGMLARLPRCFYSWYVYHWRPVTLGFNFIYPSCFYHSQQAVGAYITGQVFFRSRGNDQALKLYAALGPNGLDPVKVTTLQSNLDSLCS